MRIVKAALGTSALAAAVIGASFGSGTAFAGTSPPPPAVAATTAQVKSSPAVPNAEEWQYGGKYYSLYDCQQSGQEAENSGAQQYRCDEVIEPDGSIAYWNLYLLYYG